MTPFFGAEIKGARRWLVIFGVNVQPSEFLKPAFVILIAWLFAESTRRPEMPANTAALALLLMVVTLLVMQPDFGQTMLIALVWGALFFMAGMRLIWVGGLAGIAGVGLVGAYFTVPHVAQRIQRFMDQRLGRHLQHRPRAGELRARRLVRQRPGRGHGQAHPAGEPHRLRLRGRRRGVRHRALPDAAGAVRLHRASARCAMRMRNDDPFCRFAASGLAILFGLQSAINMAVNLHLMPAKGMTLPFISYGGSSMISLAYGMGMLLALTRERPRAEYAGAAGLRLRRESGLMAAGGVLVAAGGTGGHLFPAEALAAALAKRSVAVDLADRCPRRATRRRVSAGRRSCHSERHHPRPRSAVAGEDRQRCSATALLKAWLMLPRLAPGRRGRLRRLSDHAAAAGREPARHSDADPRAERGDGPRQPVAGAARQRHRDGLCRRARRAMPALAAKATHTGNPVRPAVIAAATTPYPPLDADGPLRLLVFGGSQGARVMADIVPPAIEKLEPRLRARLHDRAAGARRGSAARPRHLRAAPGRLPRSRRSSTICRRAWRRAISIVSRSGASTVAELAAIGRPGILVPLPHALDQDQRANAGVLMDAGGAIRLDQADFTPGAAGRRNRRARRRAAPSRRDGRRRQGRRRRSTPPTGSPIWCCGWRV